MCCKEFTAKRVPRSFAKFPGQSFFKTLLSGPLVWSRDSKPFVDWLHVLKVSLTKFLWNRMASRQINNTSSTLRNIRITFFYLLFGHTTDFGPLSRGQQHSPDANQCVFVRFWPGSHRDPHNKAGFRRLAERLVGFEFVHNVCLQASNLFTTVLSTRLLSSKMCLGHCQISVMKLLCVNSYKYSKF